MLWSVCSNQKWKMISHLLNWIMIYSIRQEKIYLLKEFLVKSVVNLTDTQLSWRLCPIALMRFHSHFNLSKIYKILCPLIISTFSWGKKRCAYYRKSAFYECAYYKWAQYALISKEEEWDFSGIFHFPHISL